MKSALIYTAIAIAAGAAVALAIPHGDSRQAAETASVEPTTAKTGGSPSGVPRVAAQTPAAPGDARGLADLEQRLLKETRARRELESEVAALRRQVEELQLAAGASTARGQAASNAAGDAANAWFDEQALVASGMDAALAGELKVFFERLEFERLQLRDRAAREDWDRARRRAGLDALDDRERQLRERLGDSGYDAYLYAAGRPNRVAVTSVLASAPAGQAGIRAGDYILRYGNQRIYDWSDLRAATSAGNLGDPVELEVERDGEKLQVYLARGPLGVRTDSRSVAP